MGNQNFSIIFHCPETEAGMQQLAKTVSAIRAQSVLRYINRLSISNPDKVRLLDNIISRERALIRKSGKTGNTKNLQRKP